MRDSGKKGTMGRRKKLVLSSAIYLLVLLLSFTSCEGRHASKRASQEQDESSSSTDAKVLLFGNPQVYGSSLSDADAYVQKATQGKIPINLDLYEESTKALSGEDENVARDLIIQRFRRSTKDDDNADKKREELDDDEDQEMMRKKKEEEDEEQLEQMKKIQIQNNKTLTSSTTASPVPVTNVKPKMNPGVSGSPPRPNQAPFIPKLGPLDLSSLLSMNRGNNTPPKKTAKKGELYLPEDYNNLEIPKLDGSRLFGAFTHMKKKLAAVPVLVFLNIRNVREIDEEDEQILLDLDMKVEWVDGILFDPLKALTQKTIEKPMTLNPVFLKRIWQPDIYIDETLRVRKNELMASPHTLLFSQTTGLVSYTFRALVYLSCDMDFFYYPADTHRCKFHVRSYSYFDYDLDMTWLRNGVFLQDPQDPNFDLQIADVEGVKIPQVFNEANNDTYDGLTFTIVARRKLSYHMVQTYLPSVFFIIITWLCFLVPARMVEARIGISMTTLLTLTAMFSSVRESTPIVSYVKAIDVWMVICIFLVFLTLLEFSLLLWIRSFREDAEEKKLLRQREMQRSGKKSTNFSRSDSSSSGMEDLKNYEKLAEFIEKWGFVIFSVAFLIFNVWYWSWLITSSDYLNWSVNSSHNAPLEKDND